MLRRVEEMRVSGDNSAVVTSINNSNEFCYINDNDDEKEGEREEVDITTQQQQTTTNEVESVQYNSDTWPQEHLDTNDYSTMSKNSRDEGCE